MTGPWTILAPLLGPSRRSSARGSATSERQDAPEISPDVLALDRALSGIETAARSMFALFDLPDRPGEYARSPDRKRWKYLGETLSAEERWSLVLSKAPGAGWKFGALEDLVKIEAPPGDLETACDILVRCRELRRILASDAPLTAGDIESAIRLGGEAQDLRMAISRRTEPVLKLTAVKPSRRRAARPTAGTSK